MNTIYISIIKKNAPHLSKVLLNLSTNNSRKNREERKSIENLARRRIKSTMNCAIHRW